MKLTLTKLALLIFINLLSFGNALADDIKLTCPKMNSFILERYDSTGELLPMKNSIAYPLNEEHGGGWVVRMLFEKDSPWNFWDIAIQTHGVTNGLEAWEKAKEIKQASLKSIPVLRKHFFNKDRTGSYFYTCAYPIDHKYALSGDSITASTGIFTDGVGMSKEDNGTVSVIYDFFSSKCASTDICMLD